MKRGAVKKTESKMVNVWLPNQLLPVIDRAVQVEDSDRSKFIRAAIREKLARAGLPIKEVA
jgi:metal-responsive CopG/Arc/MetJ family transcriptional regulator